MVLAAWIPVPSVDTSGDGDACMMLEPTSITLLSAGSIDPRKPLPLSASLNKSLIFLKIPTVIFTGLK